MVLITLLIILFVFFEAAAALNNLNAAQKSKKPVPRLRLEEIPTFHGHNKSNKPMTQYQIPLKSNHDSDENGKN